MKRHKAPRSAEAKITATPEHPHVERVLDRTLTSVPTPVVLLDEWGKIVAANDAWRELVLQNGETVDDLPGDAYYRQVAAVLSGEATGEQPAESIQEVLSGDQPSSQYELRYRSRGVDRWLLARASRLPGDGPRRILISHEDISEQKAAEQRREETERDLANSFSLLRATLESTADGILVVDSEGRVSRLNRTFLDLWHIPSDLAHSRDDNALVAFVLDQLTDPRAFIDKIKELYASPDATSFDVLNFKDGRVFERYSQPQRVNGISVGRVWSFRDITERRRAVEGLQRLREAIDASIDGIAILDSGGSFRYVNRAFATLHGYADPEQVIGQSFRRFYYEEEMQRLDESAIFALRQDGRWRGEATGKRVDGTTFPQEISLTVLAHGEIASIVRDISDRKRAEAALRQSEQHLRQSQKMEAIGRLAGGIAHDFNNLLTVISSYTAMLLEDMPETESMRPDLEAIRLAGNRAAALTRQLLAFSRRQMLQPRIIDLNMVIAGMEGMLRRLIGEDIELIIKIAPRLGAVRADPGQFEQILMNLAVNARDAMPIGGMLAIETANVSAETESLPDVSGGSYVRLTVRDTGVGISEETISHIFEPFFTTKETGMGSGLGLATVYGIVEQSHGYLRVDSKLDEGAAFHIFLPAVTERDDELATQSTAQHSGGSETILLVEDDRAVRTVVKRVLITAGYTVIEAQHGADALRVAAEQKYGIDLVLTDVIMPELGGRELAEQLRVIRPEIPVLFMSGYTDDEIVRRGMLDPASVFLHKPFTPDELTRAVRNSLDVAAKAAARPAT